eukprot:scaffold2264_cov287-Pinguiococcus_pyrenoidosus.AAC.5
MYFNVHTNNISAEPEVAPSERSGRMSRNSPEPALAQDSRTCRRRGPDQPSATTCPRTPVSSEPPSAVAVSWPTSPRARWTLARRQTLERPSIQWMLTRSTRMQADDPAESTENNVEALATLHRLLDNDHYHIEFHGCLPNHVKPTLVAIHGLKADVHAIWRYWSFYTECTPYGYPLSPRQRAEAPLGPNEWRDLMGERRKYAELLLFFDQEEQQCGLQETIRKFAPTLVVGMPGALTHGIIHVSTARACIHLGGVAS